MYPTKPGEEKEALDEYSRDFFSGKVLSTLFGDDVPNGTPINFDEGGPRLPQEAGQENVVQKVESRGEVIVPEVA